MKEGSRTSTSTSPRIHYFAPPDSSTLASQRPAFIRPLRLRSPSQIEAANLSLDLASVTSLPRRPFFDWAVRCGRQVPSSNL